MKKKTEFTESAELLEFLERIKIRGDIFRCSIFSFDGPFIPKEWLDYWIAKIADNQPK